MEISRQVRERVAPTKGKVPVTHAVGRRKAAVARVWVSRGAGAVTVNGKEVANYFSTDMMCSSALRPSVLLPHLAANYDIAVNIVGGGLSAQADAMKLGMSRAFVKINEETRRILRAEGLLTADSRRKERKKPGRKGARRGFQFVKR